jgi:hypothetical protein
MIPTEEAAARRGLREVNAKIAAIAAEEKKAHKALAKLEAQCVEPIDQQDELAKLHEKKREAVIEYADRLLAGEDVALPSIVAAPTTAIVSEARERAETHKQTVQELQPAIAKCRKTLDACANARKAHTWQKNSLLGIFVEEDLRARVAKREAAEREMRLDDARIAARRAWLVEHRQPERLQGLPESLEAMPSPAQVEMDRRAERRALDEWVARLESDPDANPDEQATGAEAIVGAVAQSLSGLRQAAAE